ncbi:MAG: hypothetical protein K2K56_03985 [Lachnospiraceae bacterium]|nr:hypothetical protein [Lachnospiraceae bacterium]
MNIEQLRSYLIINDVPDDLYSLDGGLPSEAYCINKVEEGWEVYYSERGLKSQLVKFDIEDKACLYLQSIIKDILKL